MGPYTLEKVNIYLTRGGCYPRIRRCFRSVR
jgi:hypothetical protein